jgi:hypothetical protein
VEVIMVWIVAGVALAVVMVFVIGRGLASGRRRALRAWARERGLAFSAGPDRQAGITYLELPLLGSGPATARNTATGRWRDRDVRVFDVLVGPDREGEAAASRHTCALVAADRPLIPLCIRPVDLGDRAVADLGPNEVTLPDPAFAARYEVATTDAAWADQVLQPDLTAYLRSRPSWRVELGGAWCLVAAPGQLDPDQLDEALTTAAGVLDRVPSPFADA